MQVTLEPKTRAGQNKLANDRSRAVGAWDGTYNVVQTSDHVQFAAGKRGPWYLLTPTCDMDVAVLWRWVHGTDDDDFTLQPNTGIKGSREAASP